MVRMCVRNVSDSITNQINVVYPGEDMTTLGTDNCRMKSQNIV